MHYYEGQTRNSQPYGVGTMIGKDGEEYYGDWIAGFRTGTGLLKWTKDGETYTFEGKFFHGNKHGKGKSIDSKGRTEEGQWNNGVRTG